MTELKEYLSEKEVSLYYSKRNQESPLGIQHNNKKYRFRRLGLQEEFNWLTEREQEYQKEKRLGITIDKDRKA